MHQFRAFSAIHQHQAAAAAAAAANFAAAAAANSSSGYKGFLNGGHETKNEKLDQLKESGMFMMNEMISIFMIFIFSILK